MQEKEKDVILKKEKMSIRMIMLSLFGLFYLLPTAAQPPSADEILRLMEQTLFPDQYTLVMSMETRDPGGRNRVLEMKTFYRRDTGSFMEILSPARSRGTRFLEKDDTLWMYIPRSNSRSAIRLSPRDSFQGSAFSNDDVGDSNYTEDYTSRLLRQEVFNHEQLGSVDCYVIEALPARPEAPYGKIVSWVTKEDYIPLKMEYYVRSGLQTKVMTLFDIQSIAGRRRPLRMEMRAIDEADKVSVVTIKEIEAVPDLADRFFTRRYLTR